MISPKNLFSPAIMNNIPTTLLLPFLCGCMVLGSCMAQDRRQHLPWYQTETSGIKDGIAATNHFNWYGSLKMPVKPEDNMELQVSKYVRRIFQDKTGFIWFGTQGNGVARYSGDLPQGKTGRLDYFSIAQGLSGDVVRGMAEDKQGNIWFATNNGICRYDISLADNPCNYGTCKHSLHLPEERAQHNGELAKAFTTYNINNGLAGNDVWSILVDSNGLLWVGTTNGLSRMSTKTNNLAGSPEKFTGFPFPKAEVAYNSRFSPKLVWAIYEDKENNIWLATDGEGLRKYNNSGYENGGETGSRFATYTTRDGLASNNISSILQDKQGNIWFGTRDAGISRYNGKSFTTFTKDDGLCHDFIWTLHEDKAGNLWMGSAGGGLSKFDGNRFINYGEKDGLRSRHIQSIVEDNRGNLWLGVSGGVYRFDGKKFTNFRRPGC